MMNVFQRISLNSVRKTTCLLSILLLVPACVDSTTGNDGKVTGGVDAGTTDSGGGALTVDCGNAICDEGESFFNCRNDCTAPDYAACYAEKCTTQWDRCLDDQECRDAMHCIELCKGDGTCGETCYFTAPDEVQIAVDSLLQCANENGCNATEPGPGPGPVTNECPGECGEYVEGADCQCEENCKLFGDCCEGYEALCESPETCGNGRCDEGEDATNCPKDCTGETLDPLEQCIVDSCPDQVAACEADPTCATVLDCVDQCPQDDQGCQFACFQQGGFNSALIQLGICVQQAGCLESAGTECGNGECEDGENQNNCPEDCDGPNNPVLQCAVAECPDQYDACLGDDGCAAVIACIDNCPEFGQEQCLQGCLQQAGFSLPAIQLATCVQQSGCLEQGPGPGNDCGDGECGPGENPDNCPQDCGEETDCIDVECPGELEECLSDDTCYEWLVCQNNCNSQNCVDECWEEAGQNGPLYDLVGCYQDNCSEDQPPPDEPTCGDGVCEGDENINNCKEDCFSELPGECGDGVCNMEEYENDSCPEDCNPEPTYSEYLQCVEKVCSAEWETCEDSGPCNEVLDCVKKCDDQDCTDECIENAPFWTFEDLDALGECAEKSGCAPEGPGPGPGPDPEPDPEDESIEECLAKSCQDVVDDCMDDETCKATYECLVSCEGNNCVPECVQQGGFSQEKGQLMQCGNQANCWAGPGGGGGGGGG